MDTRNPTEKEFSELKRLHASYKAWTLIGPTVLLSLLIAQLVVSGVILKIILVALGLVIFAYWSMSFAVLRKCPRCSSRKTLPKGSCTSCGLRLEIADPDRSGPNVT